MYRFLVILFVFSGWCISATLAESVQNPDDIDPSVELLSGHLTSFDTSASILIKIDGAKSSDISISCEGIMQVIESRDVSSTIRWTPDVACRLPILTLRGSNYILPIRGFLPNLEAIADISTTTLRNTLGSGRILRSNVKLSGLQIRKFFSNIDRVLTSRIHRFSLPIPDAQLPTKESFLPNSLRPYRLDSTDGVHHGWDFYVPEDTEVLAVDDGVILHVKNNFSWNEMDSLEPGRNDLDLQKNLDVYRGNTVYLKTLSGHVAIYAHLNNLPSEIQPGVRVARGTVLGHVGDSAVPDKRYLYHLHFELVINPLRDANAGSYTHDDILLWSWFGKGKGTAWVRENDEAIFGEIQ